MLKSSERINVLTESNGKNFVHSILNAVTKGYSDNVIIEDVLDLIRTNELSKGILTTSPEVLIAYSDSISQSLKNIANEIKNFEIQDQQLQIKRKTEQKEKEEEENDDVEVSKFDEMQQEQKKSSKLDPITISEDWEKSSTNEKENKISGTLLVNFNQDMSIYKKGNELNLKKSSIDHVTSKIFDYFKSEYPQLKASLSDKIFKSDFIFDNLKIGSSSIKYEINEAF